MIESILRSHRYSIEHLAGLVGDVPEERMAEQPAGMVNHGAWTIGHLTVSCQAIGEEFGIGAWLGADWPGRYGTGSVPRAERAAYPSKGELLAALRDGHVRLAARLRADWESVGVRPLPDARYRSVLPTLGDAAVQILVSHTAYHVGQVAIWRRALGMPPNAAGFL